MRRAQRRLIASILLLLAVTLVCVEARGGRRGGKSKGKTNLSFAAVSFFVLCKWRSRPRLSCFAGRRVFAHSRASSRQSGWQRRRSRRQSAPLSERADYKRLALQPDLSTRLQTAAYMSRSWAAATDNQVVQSKSRSPRPSTIVSFIGGRRIAAEKQHAREWARRRVGFFALASNINFQYYENPIGDEEIWSKVCSPNSGSQRRAVRLAAYAFFGVCNESKEAYVYFWFNKCLYNIRIKSQYRAAHANALEALITICNRVNSKFCTKRQNVWRPARLGVEHKEQ